ncbi:MAG: glutamine-hydrolyzing carbamoyl-phosphate synthase small subunit [Pseudomonadota bacterium]
MKLCQASSVLRTGAVVLASGKVFKGKGFGAVGDAVGELCFNTAMTGYQEILTDPSYAGQIITFTAPHIGNVGVNGEDVENACARAVSAARGAIVREETTMPSNYRAQMDLGGWMRRRGLVGVSDVDTRALTALIRRDGMQHAVIAHDPAGAFNIDQLVEKARGWAGVEGADLAKDVSTEAPYANDATRWVRETGYGSDPNNDGPLVVVIDYGVKGNILRLLSSAGARVRVAPSSADLQAIMEMKPDGVVLSNGPGDPAATAQRALPTIQGLIDANVPVFGICLGHQLLALAVGAKTKKMAQGHHGANHPVKNIATGKVEIVSMNHGFTVDETSLPENAEATFVSLFDGTNSGLRLKDKPVMSVQHHPEASPGPQDSFGVFQKFVDGLNKKAA